jgi:hypothetical protein
MMPPAMSQEATDSICAMLDGLAENAVSGDGEDRAAEVASAPWRLAWPVSAAAVLAALLVSRALFPSSAPQMAPTASSPAPLAELANHGWILVDETTRIESVEDEGWLDDPDGGAMHAVRMQLVEENRIFDEETGIIVSISEPREEMLLMPVSNF